MSDTGDAIAVVALLLGAGNLAWRGWDVVRARRRLRIGWRVEQDPTHADIYIWVVKRGAAPVVIREVGLAWLKPNSGWRTPDWLHRRRQPSWWTAEQYPIELRPVSRWPRLVRWARGVLGHPEQWDRFILEPAPGTMAEDGAHVSWKRCAEELIGGVRLLKSAPTHLYAQEVGYHAIPTTKRLRDVLAGMAQEDWRNPLKPARCSAPQWYMEPVSQADISDRDVMVKFQDRWMTEVGEEDA